MAPDLEAVAARIAVRAGELIKNMRVNAAATSITKSSPVDMVTEADRAAERLIAKLITAEFPHDSILGEEGGLETSGDSDVTWVVDPIDGTTNYVYGHAASCVSIAATVPADAASSDPNVWIGEPSHVARRTVAGVIYNPFTDELFTASIGKGATLNGSPISIKRDARLETTLLATGFGYSPERRREQAEILVHLLPRIRDIRRIGSAAYDLCLLASGRLDAYYEMGIQEWDFAAGVLIATEAGASLRGCSPNNLPGTRTLIVAHERLADEIQRIVCGASLSSE